MVNMAMKDFTSLRKWQINHSIEKRESEENLYVEDNEMNRDIKQEDYLEGL